MKYLLKLRNIVSAAVLTAIIFGVIFITPFILSVLTFVLIGVGCILFIYVILTETHNEEDDEPNP